MYLTDIDNDGCLLVYRSGRNGFTQYVMGKFKFRIKSNTIQHTTKRKERKTSQLLNFTIFFSSSSSYVHLFL